MKKLLSLLLICFALASQAQIKLGGYVTTIGSGDTYPTQLDTLGKGGWMAVSDTFGRNAIPAARRKPGMAVYTSTTNILWVLGSDLTTWTNILSSTTSAGKVNYTDTAGMLSPYLRSAIASATYATIANMNLKLYISDTSNMLAAYLAGINTNTANILLRVRYSDTSSMLTAYRNAINTNAAAILTKQAQLSGTGFVKISGTTISYDNSTYLTANQPITLTATSEATGTSSSSATSPSIALTLSNSAVIGKVLTGLSVSGTNIAATDNILTAFGKAQNQINGLAGAMTYVGTWNASTNTPTLTSSTGTKGYLYKVSTAGTTTLDGISQWNVGDEVVFNGTVWDKINGIASEVVSWNGRVGAVTLTTADVNAVSTTTVGTITTGVWNGTPIANANLANSSLTITAGTGLSGGGNVALGASSTALSVNTTQNITTLSNLTTSGFVKTSAAGVLSVDANTYLTTASAASNYLPLSATTYQNLSYNVTATAALQFANASTTGYGVVIKNGNDANYAFNIQNSAGTANILMWGDGHATYAGNITAPTFIGALTGNASTATTLQTARAIQGVNFDGSAAINIINGTGFVKASGTTISYDNSTYLTTASAAGSYVPLSTVSNVAITANLADVGWDFSNTNANSYGVRVKNANNSNASFIVRDGTGTALGNVINMYGDGHATFLSTVTASSFSGAGTGLTGTASSLTAGAVTNGVYTNTQNSLNTSVSGSYAFYLTNTSTTGYGFALRNNNDANQAFVINNAANTQTNIQMFGDGHALFAGSITGVTEATGDNSTKIASTAFVKNQSYLTTSSASGTYLPLVGGTLTGALVINTTGGNTSYTKYQNAGTSIGIVGTDNSIFGTTNSDFGTYVYGSNSYYIATNGVRALTVAGNQQTKFYTNSSSIPALVTTGAGTAGSVAQGQIQFGDLNQYYKIQAGADYSGMNFIVNNVTGLILASSGAANFNGNPVSMAALTATSGSFSSVLSVIGSNTGYSVDIDNTNTAGYGVRIRNRVTSDANPAFSIVNAAGSAYGMQVWGDGHGQLAAANIAWTAAGAFSVASLTANGVVSGLTGLFNTSAGGVNTLTVTNTNATAGNNYGVSITAGSNASDYSLYATDKSSVGLFKVAGDGSGYAAKSSITWTAAGAITTSGGTISMTSTAGYLSLTARTGSASNGTLLFNNGTGSNFVLQETASNVFSIGSAGAGSVLSAPTMDINTSTKNVTFYGSIIKSGGTSTQYLMADGSVSTGTGGTYLPLAGGTMTGTIVGVSHVMDSSNYIPTTYSVMNWTSQKIDAGNYVPTLTNGTNAAGSSINTCQWVRVGNKISVTGKITINASSTGTTLVYASVPTGVWITAPSFSNDWDADGIAVGNQGNGFIQADTVNGGRVTFQVSPTASGNSTYRFQFTYQY